MLRNRLLRTQSLLPQQSAATLVRVLEHDRLLRAKDDLQRLPRLLPRRLVAAPIPQSLRLRRGLWRRRVRSDDDDRAEDERTGRAAEEAAVELI
jgi:hypothetical protein